MRRLSSCRPRAWLQTLLRWPAEVARRPTREWRPAVFLCDEYQSFATVGEDDPAGDEKAFALTRQSRLIPIVATQSISSGGARPVRSVAGAAPDAPHTHLPVAGRRCVGAGRQRPMRPVLRMKASYSLSEQTSRAGASLLSGSPGGGTGGISASKSFTERHEPLFHPRDFTTLGNCQAIVLPYDGKRAGDGWRCYLKPDFLPQDRPYWRAREAGDL